jgi:hypothetical protein
MKPSTEGVLESQGSGIERAKFERVLKRLLETSFGLKNLNIE